MIISLNFVEKFISLPKIVQEIIVNNKVIQHKLFDTEKISSILTRQGFEVDSVKLCGENLSSVVVGKIESAIPHPNANKLQICQVNTGEAQLRQIVCGAPNARPNLYVAVALPQTKLPNGLEIKPTSIRDIESHGMLCSREELGLPINKEVDGEGIWEINIDATGGKSEQELEKNMGMPLFHVLALDDVILDISVTPNRPDILCHEGVARELAAGFTYLGIHFEQKNFSFSKKSVLTEEKIKHDAIKNKEISYENKIVCAENHVQAPTYFMLLDTIQVNNSPAWLRNILEALGQASINNIVDASNFILLAYGQPSHAYDYKMLDDNKKLIIRHAHSDEDFLGLDGKPRKLNEADCVVANGNEVLSLFGVIGGESSKVTSTTNKIIVEFANADAVTTRRSSRRHGRQTDASFLFEKGINAADRFKAGAEFIALLNELCENKINYVGAFHSKDKQNNPLLQTQFTPHVIPFTQEHQKNILGSDIISFEAQKNILSSLGFKIKEEKNNFMVEVPSWRSSDVAHGADLVEEFIRIVGIDHVPAQSIYATNDVKKDDPHFSYLEKLNAHCAQLGYNEVIGLHFMRADDYEKCQLNSIHHLGEPIALLNPILGDEPFLHNTLIPDLFRKVTKNLNYGVKNGQLFHSCRTFQNTNANGERVFLDNGANLNLKTNLSQPLPTELYEYSYQYGYTYSKDSQSRPVETPRMAGVIFGVKEEKTWQNKEELHWTLHDVMSHVVELGRIMEIHFEFDKMTTHPMANALHPGRQVEFFVTLPENKKLPIGWCGQVLPKVLRNYEIEGPCFAFELNVANMMLASSSSNKLTKNILSFGKFPIVHRDFAFLLDEKVTAKEIQDCLKNSLSEMMTDKIPANLLDIVIFDIYRGKNIAQGQKSVTFKLSLEPILRTFTDKDIQLLCDKVIATMENYFNGKLRG